MEHNQWLDILGWGEEEIDDLRFVAYAYIRQGLYDIALTFFEALIVLAPHDPYNLQTLGALYLQKGDNLGALNYLERSLKIDPTHIPTLLNRTKVLFALGYHKQAVLQAIELQKQGDPHVAAQSIALMMAYGQYPAQDKSHSA